VTTRRCPCIVVARSRARCTLVSGDSFRSSGLRFNQVRVGVHDLPIGRIVQLPESATTATLIDGAPAGAIPKA
jgi:hypothetical protein